MKKKRIISGIKNQGALTHKNKEKINNGKNLARCRWRTCYGKIISTIEKARFRKPVIPDCVLELNIEAIRSHGRVWKYKGTAFVGDKKMADAQWTATIVDRK